MTFNTNYAAMTEPFASQYQSFTSGGRVYGYFGLPLVGVDPTVTSQEEAYELAHLKQLLRYTQPAELRGSLNPLQTRLLDQMEQMRGLTDETAASTSSGYLVPKSQFDSKQYAVVNPVSGGGVIAIANTPAASSVAAVPPQQIPQQQPQQISSGAQPLTEPVAALGGIPLWMAAAGGLAALLLLRRIV